MPTSPVNAAGWRIDPPVSEAVAAKAPKEAGIAEKSTALEIN